MYFFSQPILDMFKQNTHQMKIFEISILLAFFTKNESSPCFTNESSPCFTNESSPCFTNESSPCFTNESSPCFTNESSPCFTNESSPCFTNESSPCFTNESSPVHVLQVQSRFYNMPFSIGKFAIRGLFFCLSQSKSVSRVKQHSGSDFCSLLPGNSNALPRIWRPKLAEHFPSTRIAIIGTDYFAIFRDCSEL